MKLVFITDYTQNVILFIINKKHRKTLIKCRLTDKNLIKYNKLALVFGGENKKSYSNKSNQNLTAEDQLILLLSAFN